MKRKWHVATSLLWLLALAILATIYLAWLAYPLVVDYFRLDIWSGLSKPVILKNYKILMTYLVSPFVSQLAMPDFPASASGIKHFADVKVLFQLAQGVFIVLAYPTFILFKNHYQTKTLWKLQTVWLSALIMPLIIAVFGFLIGFERFFTLFHNVLFPGDSSWLFNPETDPIILVLPAQFFLSCFIAFFVIYEGILIGLWLYSKKQWRQFRAKMWP